MKKVTFYTQGNNVSINCDTDELIKNLEKSRGGFCFIRDYEGLFFIINLEQVHFIQFENEREK